MRRPPRESGARRRARPRDRSTTREAAGRVGDPDPAADRRLHRLAGRPDRRDEPRALLARAHATPDDGLQSRARRRSRAPAGRGVPCRSPRRPRRSASGAGWTDARTLPLENDATAGVTPGVGRGTSMPHARVRRCATGSIGASTTAPIPRRQERSDDCDPHGHDPASDLPRRPLGRVRRPAGRRNPARPDEPAGSTYNATPEQYEEAVQAAVRAFEVTRKLPAYERGRILREISAGHQGPPRGAGRD